MRRALLLAVLVAIAAGCFMPEPTIASFPICFLGHYGQPGGCRIHLGRKERP